MIGMDVRLYNETRCRRMFPPWTLLFGALSTFLVSLCTFIFNPDVHTSFESLLGSSWLSIFDKFMTYLKEQMPIAALTVRKETQIVGLSRNLG